MIGIKVICSMCSKEQEVQQYCKQCGVCMGNYYCAKCKFFDDDVSKKQYHCDQCGICRTGGAENFFHCEKCGKRIEANISVQKEIMPIREACHVVIQRHQPSKHRLWKHALARQEARGQSPTPVLQIMSPVDDEEDSVSKKRISAHLRSYSAEEESMPDLRDIKTENTFVRDSSREETDSMEQVVAVESNISSRLHRLSRILSNLEIPKRESLLENRPQAAVLSRKGSPAVESSASTEAYHPSEQEYIVPKQNLFDEDHEETEEESIPEESILKSINSLKGMKSYQLGKQLSCKWTTGAGPHIGCVRDYPLELQFRALEHVNLSPRKANRPASYFSPRISNVASPTMLSPRSCGGEVSTTLSPATFDRASLLSRSFTPARTQSSPLFVGSRVTKISSVS